MDTIYAFLYKHICAARINFDEIFENIIFRFRLNFENKFLLNKEKCIPEESFATKVKTIL